MQIRGKRALVLGASRGIGLAIARTLADEGVRLALPWYDWPDSAMAMIEEFDLRREGHLPLQTDVRQPREITALMHAIQEQFSGLDILVNNIERGGMPILHGGYDRVINREQFV